MKKLLCTIALLMGFTLACEHPETSISNIPSTIYQGGISIAEAKDWFNTQLSKPNAREGEKGYERDIDWNSAKKVKQTNSLELVIVFLPPFVSQF